MSWWSMEGFQIMLRVAHGDFWHETVTLADQARATS